MDMSNSQTMIEKIISGHCGKMAFAGDIVTADVDTVFFHDGNRPLAIEVFDEFGVNRIFNPAKVFGIIDHAPSCPTESVAKMHYKIRQFQKKYGIKLYECGDGSCHQIITEKGHALPGQIIIGSDSHSCTHGAMNAFSTGVGVSDLTSAIITGKLWFLVPETIKVTLKGKLPKGVFAKDIILYIAGLIGANGANYKALEFCGDGVGTLSVSSRMTITNMAIEVGAKCAVMPFDGVLETWLREHGYTGYTPVHPDEGAVYCKEITVDLEKLVPQIAKPHKVDNVVEIGEVLGTPVRQGIIGTCTNGRMEDLEAAACILKGKHIAPGFTLIVAPASREIFIEASRSGLLEVFLKAGANIAMPGCSACSAGAYVGVPFDGENVITTANRNFKGRLGNPKSFIYLASPATVAATALTGKMEDCRTFMDKEGGVRK